MKAESHIQRIGLFQAYGGWRMFHQLQYYRMLLVDHRVYVLSKYKAVIVQSIIKQSIFVMGKPYVFCELGNELLK
jgi:hypothetical protein